MSYVKMLKNGDFRPKKPKNPRLTAYDRYMASRKPNTLVLDNFSTVYHPKNVADLQRIIALLKAKKGVVIDFKNLSGVTAQRLLDYLSGAVFAIEGKLDKLDDFKYLVTPKGVEMASQ